jgi:hypothetical protein
MHLQEIRECHRDCLLAFLSSWRIWFGESFPIDVYRCDAYCFLVATGSLGAGIGCCRRPGSQLWKCTGRLGPIPISLRLKKCLQSFDCVRVSCGDKELQLSIRFESETKRPTPRNKTEAFEVWIFFKQVGT